jgi:hypothetical protein
MWYNGNMAKAAPESRSATLVESNPWIRDAAARHKRFLDVAERNSVIEGLPPFTEAFREELLIEVNSVSVRERELSE